MSYLEYLDLKAHITAQTEKIIMALEDSVTRIVAAAKTEFDQLAGQAGALAQAFADLAAKVTENDDLKAQLAALQAQASDLQTRADSSSAKLDETSALLESDDPTPPAA